MFCENENLSKIQLAIEKLELLLFNMTTFRNCSTVICQHVERVFEILNSTPLIVLTDQCHQTICKNEITWSDNVFGYGFRGNVNNNSMIINHKVFLSKDGHPINHLIDSHTDNYECYIDAVCGLKNFLKTILQTYFYTCNKKCNKQTCDKQPCDKQTC